MSRNGSGTYVLPAGNPVVTGTVITSTWANTTLSDIATALTGSIASDGQTVVTGNLQLGNNRITGMADGIAATDAATLGQITNANISSGVINGAVIGNLNPANGTFTNLVATVSATVPTVATSDNSTKAASTAFVKAAIAGSSGGVTSFNTRTGAVTLLSADVTTALGYTPPTPTGTGASGTWAISISGNAGNGGVTSINGQTGAVTLDTGVPAGTTMLFYQSAAPTGWTQNTSLDDYALRLVSGAGGSTGGTSAFGTVFTNQTPTFSGGISGSAGETTLTTAQIPAHTHTFANSSGTSGGYAKPGAGTDDGSAGSGSSILWTGGGGNGSHSHSISGSASGSTSAVVLNVRYANIIICTKN